MNLDILSVGSASDIYLFFEKKPLIFRNRKKERSLLVKRIVPSRWKLRYLFLSFSRMLRYFAGRDKEEISNPIH